MRFTSDEITVRLIGTDEAEIAQFVALYERLIDPADQVDPRHILRWRTVAGQAPGSADELVAAARAPGAKPCHLLVGAWARQTMVGFANVVYLPSVQVGFFAYFGSLPATDQAGAVATRIILELDALGRELEPGWRWLVFELSRDDTHPQASLARRRLFCRHLTRLGCAPFELPLSYRVPELSADTPDPVARKARSADLLLVAPPSAARDGQEIDRNAALRILEAVYFEVYAETLTAELSSHAAALYRASLGESLRSLGRELPARIALAPAERSLPS